MRLTVATLAALSGPLVNFRATGGLFQDTSRTTAATANSAPVASWQNQSGDSYRMTQGTSGSRPLLQTALPSILFDGTDDYLSTTNTITDTIGSAVITFKTGATAFATRGVQVLFSAADTGTANTWFEIGITAGGLVYVESNAGGTKHTVTGVSILAVSTTYLLAVIHDGTDYYISLSGAEENPLTITNIGTFAWFGDVSGVDNLVLGGTVTSAGLVRPFQGEILEASLFSYDITTA